MTDKMRWLTCTHKDDATVWHSGLSRSAVRMCREADELHAALTMPDGQAWGWLAAGPQHLGPGVARAAHRLPAHMHLHGLHLPGP